MRRRDATQQRRQHRTHPRPASIVSAAVSVAVHLLLLVLLAVPALQIAQPNTLLLITLWNASERGSGASEPDASGHLSRMGKGQGEGDKQPSSHFAVPHTEKARRHGPVGREKRAAKPSPDLSTRERSGEGAIAGTGHGAGSSDTPGPAGVASAGSNGSGTGSGYGSDQRAACVYCPEPRYPLIARARGWQGTVDVGLSVLADGSVDSAALRRSSGYGVLDEAAIAVARRSRFAPPAASGLPAPLRGRIEYRFELTRLR